MRKVGPQLINKVLDLSEDYVLPSFWNVYLWRPLDLTKVSHPFLYVQVSSRAPTWHKSISGFGTFLLLSYQVVLGTNVIGCCCLENRG